MRIQNNRLSMSSRGWTAGSISFFLFLLFTQIATASELFHFNRNVVALTNQNAKENILLISPDGQADWMTLATKETKSVSYNITNPDCIPYSQNTTSMDGSHAGMTLTYPFLVGLGWACVIDDNTHTINLLSEFALPENAYSLVYAGEDASYSYFLVNSKPTKGTGYLHLVSINKNTLALTTRVLFTNVPGYSGAMLYDSGDLWVSTWPTKIYKILRQNLLNAIQKGIQVNFTEVGQQELTNGTGMSLFMVRNNNSLLYFNDEYDSYTVNFLSKKMANVSVPCLPVDGFGQEWLLLCNNNSLQNWHE